MNQIYHTRNVNNINTLASDTKAKALKFYAKCTELGAQVLIYEGIRSLEQQKKNVANGVSKTMKSYHLVGQAFDFVPVDAKGNALWSNAVYRSSPYKEAIAYAKSIGLEWGGDWKGFVDSPHLQNNYRGYGTDKFTNSPTAPPSSGSKSYLAKGDKGSAVTTLQTNLVAIGHKIAVDGSYGNATVNAVKQFQQANGLVADGVYGVKSKTTLEGLVKNQGSTSSTIKAVGKVKVDKLQNFTYVYAEPKSGSKIIEKAMKNSIYSISGSVPGWFEVIVNNKRYYISSKYCTRI